MALTTEQQSQLEFEQAMETARNAARTAETAKQVRVEAIRMAKDLLVENRRIKPAADATDITDADVTNYASELLKFINS